MRCDCCKQEIKDSVTEFGDGFFFCSIGCAITFNSEGYAYVKNSSDYKENLGNRTLKDE